MHAHRCKHTDACAHQPQVQKSGVHAHVDPQYCVYLYPCSQTRVRLSPGSFPTWKGNLLCLEKLGDRRHVTQLWL